MNMNMIQPAVDVVVLFAASGGDLPEGHGRSAELAGSAVTSQSIMSSSVFNFWLASYTIQVHSSTTAHTQDDPTNPTPSVERLEDSWLVHPLDGLRPRRSQHLRHTPCASACAHTVKMVLVNRRLRKGRVSRHEGRRTSD